MADRKPPSPSIELQVLLASRRRCCICFGLHRDLDIKQGQLAHINRDPSDSTVENLAFMCLEHHDWFDSKTSQSKGATVEEAKHYRHELFREWERRDEEDARAALPRPSARPVEPTESRTSGPQSSAAFEPIEVIDKRLNLRWIIRVSPKQWLATQDPIRSLVPRAVMEFLDGPYHAMDGCNERLEEFGGGGGGYGGESPIFRERCPGCRAQIYKPAQRSLESRYADAWTVRAQALAELQRMSRNGTVIQGSRIVLERPLYWEKMLPP
jgi:hypothetical protein